MTILSIWHSHLSFSLTLNLLQLFLLFVLCKCKNLTDVACKICSYLFNRNFLWFLFLNFNKLFLVGIIFRKSEYFLLFSERFFRQNLSILIFLTWFWKDWNYFSVRWFSDNDLLQFIIRSLYFFFIFFLLKRFWI